MGTFCARFRHSSTALDNMVTLSAAMRGAVAPVFLTLLQLAPAPRANAQQPTAADLAWMEGHWSGEAAGTRMEELWMAPDGGLLLGLHRDVRPSGRTFFEFLRIEESDSGLVYVAQPLGRPPVRFPLRSLEGSEVVFENPDHDFPQRIIYSREGDALRARVEGSVGGTERVEAWEWARDR